MAIADLITAISQAIERIDKPIHLWAIALIGVIVPGWYTVYLNGENLKVARNIQEDSTRASLGERFDESDQSTLSIIATESPPAQGIALIFYEGLVARFAWSSNAVFFEQANFQPGDEWLVTRDSDPQLINVEERCLYRAMANSPKPQHWGIYRKDGYRLSLPVEDAFTGRVEGYLVLAFLSELSPEQQKSYCQNLQAAIGVLQTGQ